MTIHMSKTDFEYNSLCDGEIKEGKVYTIIEYYNERNPRDKWYWLRPGDNGGVSGNANQQIKRYHGWRGTTYGIAKYACGLRQVLEIIQYKNGNYKITLGNDLKANEP